MPPEQRLSRNPPRTASKVRAKVKRSVDVSMGFRGRRSRHRRTDRSKVIVPIRFAGPCRSCATKPRSRSLPPERDRAANANPTETCSSLRCERRHVGRVEVARSVALALSAHAIAARSRPELGARRSEP